MIYKGTGLISKILFPFSVIILWQLATELAKNPYFPPPIKIFETAFELLLTHSFMSSLGMSLATLISGYFLGAILGLFSGVLVGSTQISQFIFIPISNFMRAIPSVAKVPLLLAIFGLGQTTRSLTIAIAVFFPILISTARAIGQTDKSQIEVAKLLRLTGLETVLHVRVPAATGEILAALYSSIQIATLIMVVSEMLGSGVGLGAFIIRAQSTYMITDMWVGIVVVGIIGSVLNSSFRSLERKLFPWFFDRQNENLAGTK